MTIAIMVALRCIYRTVLGIVLIRVQPLSRLWLVITAYLLTDYLCILYIQKDGERFSSTVRCHKSQVQQRSCHSAQWHRRNQSAQAELQLVSAAVAAAADSPAAAAAEHPTGSGLLSDFFQCRGNTVKSNQIKSEKLTIASHHQSSGAVVTAD